MHARVCTDANVYLELCGNKDGKEVWGPRHTLDNSTNNFERAQVGTDSLGRLEDRDAVAQCVACNAPCCWLALNNPVFFNVNVDA